MVDSKKIASQLDRMQFTLWLDIYNKVIAFDKFLEDRKDYPIWDTVCKARDTIDITKEYEFIKKEINHDRSH